MNSSFENKVCGYPEEAQKIFNQLRTLIHNIAKQHELGPVEETLKWGEPAFLSQYGSTVRIDWKKKTPDRIYLFFNCKTVLVETFRELFFDVLDIQGNRSIALATNRKVPPEIETCLLMALNYHKLKKRPLLGA